MAIPALARLAAAVLTNEDGRRAAGKVLALILSPLIILAAFLCCFGDGASQHNNAVVSAAFYGAEFSDKVPKEYRTHITEMQEAFSLLDSATVYVNQKPRKAALTPYRSRLFSLPSALVTTHRPTLPQTALWIASTKRKRERGW